jgi:hypothetical protein
VISRPNLWRAFGISKGGSISLEKQIASPMGFAYFAPVNCELGQLKVVVGQREERFTRAALLRRFGASASISCACQAIVRIIQS